MEVYEERRGIVSLFYLFLCIFTIFVLFIWCILVPPDFLLFVNCSISVLVPQKSFLSSHLSFQDFFQLIT